MTEQEFRELTAYQPPPPKQIPPVPSSADAATATGRKGNGPVPPVPDKPEAGVPAPSNTKGAAQPDVPPPPPVATGLPSQKQYISQIHEQPKPAPTRELPPVPVSTVAPPSVPASGKESAGAVPEEKHNELVEQFGRLSERYKLAVKEQDALTKQVAELKRALNERGDAGAVGRDFKEEIRLLGKLIDDEQSLRKALMESGTFKPGDEPYARHDKLVTVFLNIVSRLE